MFGESEEDFPLNGGSERLARLFEENSLPDISFKFSGPKHPAPRQSKSSTKNVPLKVVLGKTVGAFQMKVDGYKSEGKVGLAIIGNDEFCYYQLYMYRSDERKVTSAEINVNFQFLIQEHNYAAFKDAHNIHWSVHFEKPADLISFSKEIALARWKSARGGVTKLVQEAFKGRTEVVAKENDVLQVSYKICPLSPEYFLQEEVINRSVVGPACSSTWETDLIGACIKSKRFVIIPSHLCSSFDLLVPNGFHILFEMEIEAISPPQPTQIPSSEVLNNSGINISRQQPTQIPSSEVLNDSGINLSPPQPTQIPSSESGISSNISSQTSLIKKDNSGSLSERMARIGYGLPSLQRTENESGSNMGEKGQHITSKEPSSSLPVSHENKNAHIYEDLGATSQLSTNDITAASQFNVLFSEVRTSNSELRMNLNRVTDKVDSLLSKVDIFPQFNQKLEPAIDKIQNFDSMFRKLVEQNNSIMLHLEKNSPGQLESALNEIVSLKKRNAELESFLDVSGSTCQILKDKVTELNEKLFEAERMKISSEVGSCALCQGGGERKIKSLEASVKSLQERNYDLLEVTGHLEKQNRELTEQASLGQDKKLREQLKEKDLKIAQLEREVNKLSARVKNSFDKDLVEREITDSVKGLMNKTYKMLKDGLKTSVKDSVQLDQLLARILKETTVDHLHQAQTFRSPSSTLCRVDEESNESLDEIPRREDKSEQGNITFSPSLTPLPVPRPRKPLSNAASSDLIPHLKPSPLPKDQNLHPSEHDVVMKQTSEQPLPSSEQPLPSSEQPLPSSEQPLPSSEQPLPSPEQPLPSSEQPLPSSEQPLPSSEQSLPSSGHPLLSSEELLPSSEQLPPSSEKPLPRSQHLLHTSQQPLLSSDQLLPSSHQLPKLQLPTSQQEANGSNDFQISKENDDPETSIEKLSVEVPQLDSSKEIDTSTAPAIDSESYDISSNKPCFSSNDLMSSKNRAPTSSIFEPEFDNSNKKETSSTNTKKTETIPSLFEPYSSSYYAPLFPTSPPPIDDD